MTGSLIVGAYDLLDASTPGVLSTRDFGTSVPDVTTVARLLLDGDVVSGARSGNRAISLNVWIDTGNRSGDAQLQADLFAVVDQQQWQMTWTPEPGMSSVVFDCWRGALAPTWDSVMQTGGRFVVLEFPASPFLRDAIATVLAPPATMPAPVVLDTLTTTTGLTTLPATTVAVDLAQVGGGSAYGAYAFLDPTMAGDAVAATVSVDSTTSPTGTGGSVMVTTPLIPGSTTSSYGFVQWAIPHTFAPFTINRALAATTDLSAIDRISWSAKLESPVALSIRNPTAGVDPTVIGIAPAMQDGSQLAGEITTGTWTLTLFDTTGLKSTWLVAAPPSAQWSSMSAQISVPASSADANFDITHVASYRLRCYILDGALTTTTLPTPELFPTAKQSGVGVNLLNCTTSVPWTDAGVLYGRTYVIPMFPTGSGGTMEISRPDTVPVTAGQVYSGRGYVRSQDLGEAYLSFPGFYTESMYAAMTFQCGVEWLNSSGTVISTSWAATGSPLLRVYGAPAAQLATVGGEIWRAAESTVPNVTAPAGAVSARIRYRATNAVNPVTPIWTMAPRLVAGSTAWRFPYATAPGGTPPGYLNGAQTQPVAARMWLSSITATARTTGVTFTGPYGFAEFDNVQGAARTPVSLAVRATTGTPSRLLLARCADPGPGYTPFLTPGTAVLATATVATADATALTGQNLSTGTYAFAGTYGASWTVPAVGFSGTYTVVARMRLTSTPGAVTPPNNLVMGAFTTAFNLTGDPTVTTLSRSNPITALDQWQWVTLGAVPLPTRNVDPTNTTQALTITTALPSNSSNAAHFLFDMIVLIDQTGEVVFVDGVSATRYWIDAPTSSAFTGTVYAGNNATRSDALSCAPYQSGQAVINFDPGRNMLLYVIDQATAGTITLTYSAMWPGERP